MNEREKILARIREALTVQAPMPGHHGAGTHAPSATPPSAEARAWLPPTGESFQEQLERFRANATDLKIDFQTVNGRDEFKAALVKLRDAEGWKKIASHAGELTDLAVGALGLPVCRTDQQYAVTELETSDAGITECDALIAQ